MLDHGSTALEQALAEGESPTGRRLDFALLLVGGCALVCYDIGGIFFRSIESNVTKSCELGSFGTALVEFGTNGWMGGAR